jgi:hypothetical protein
MSSFKGTERTQLTSSKSPNKQTVNICSAISIIDNLTSPSNMWNVLILWIALSAWILTLETFSDLIIFELVSCVLSVPLNDDIMMYKSKDISTLPAIQWGLKHEATALSCYLKTFAETHRAVEVVKPGLLTHRKYSYTRELPDAIISCNCHAIQRIKTFHILDGEVKLSMKDIAEQIFIVCAYLVNLQSPIVKR